MRTVPDDSLSAHYTRGDLVSRALTALADDGIALENLTPELLAPLDQFHTRGRTATLELLELAELTSTDRVLDVGGGIGGAARTLASNIGCRVHVVDLMAEYCRAGAELTRLMGLESMVTFEQGDARALTTIADGTIDVVWTQHSSMNVREKAGMYAEFWRVLRPGGRFVMHEICAGGVRPLRLPVPWATLAQDSHLLSVADTAAAIREAGFERRVWRETAEQSLTWFRRHSALERARHGAPSLGLHVLLGPKAFDAIANLVTNLAEGRVTVVQGVYRKQVEDR